MKKYFFVCAIFSLFSLLSYSQGGVVAYLSYSDFNTGDNKPFLETYLTVIGNSLNYKENAAGKFQGTVHVSIAFVQNDVIKNYKKYNLLSGELDSANGKRNNFIDLQRFSLENGEYDMELEISDNNANIPSFKYNEKIVINYEAQKVNFSEIELVESYSPTQKQNILSKSGYDLIPYVSKYYPPNFNKLNFYAEVYNVNKVLPEKEKFLLSFYIQDYDTKEKLNDFSNFTKLEVSPVSGLLNSFNLEKLPTGNYDLCIEARSKENVLLAEKKVFFQRFNPQKSDSTLSLANINEDNTFLKNYRSLDSLYEMILSLQPISNVSESNYAMNQLNSGDIQLMKKFFYAFWKKRNPLHPEEEWLKYEENVEEVNRLFGTSIRDKKGFSTDRGRVYLQYGKPDIRTVNEHEPSSYPYEIWQFNRLPNGQTNRKFVFYNPYLGSNDYRLIHSDARGEVFDSRWRYKIDDRSSIPASQKYNLDNENINRNDFGREVDDLFNNPR